MTVCLPCLLSLLLVQSLTGFSVKRIGDMKLTKSQLTPLLLAPDPSQMMANFPIHPPEQADLRLPKAKSSETADVCVIGGGVSGLTAAFKVAEDQGKVVLLESTGSFGGRVQSDTTKDGFVLDRGFAVFIEEYPAAKRLLDYEHLQMGRFQPGALIHIPTNEGFSRVADPLRQPQHLLASLMAPVGTFFEKLALVPLVLTVRSKSIESIFDEPETNTLEALQNRWGVGPEILERFLKPFLEGIYLSPLNKQSSRMFMFVLKMFTEGAAALPTGGIGQVSEQLLSKATRAGADLRCNSPVIRLSQNDDGYLLQTLDGETRVQAKSVVVATDVSITRRLLSQIDECMPLISNDYDSKVEQRQVGCVYYGFDGEAPVKDPILILNGGPTRGNPNTPINNVCFPSAVVEGYAPPGKSLCSVAILKDAMQHYEGKEDELDDVIRRELGQWFPECRSAILDPSKWQLKGMYNISNAQPDQLRGLCPANVNGGRPPDTYLGQQLPPGLFVCGDHMATSSLNGALQSGEAAGVAAAQFSESKSYMK